MSTSVSCEPRGRSDAAETMLRDWDDFVSFYDLSDRAIGSI